MTVLDKKVAGGIEGHTLGKYVTVALLAAAVGVVSVLGIQAITGDADFGPAQIEQARYSAFADHLENQWIAEVNVARANDLIEFYRAPFMARVARIQEHRAADMVEHYSKLHAAKVASIEQQRAEDMVRFQYGAGR